MRTTASILVSLSACLAAGATSCGGPGKFMAVSGHTIALNDYSADGNNSVDGNVTSLGVEGHVMMLGPDISLGVEQRKYDGESANEVFLGGRFFLINLPFLNPYLSARVRYGDGVDLPNSDSYEGYGVGGGTFVRVGDHLFFDVLAQYEGLFSEPDIGGTSTSLDGVTLTLGVGFAF